MYPPFSRFVRVLFLLLSFYTLFLFATFCLNQASFQKYIDEHYITWDDLPNNYTDVLRSKDGKQLEDFDYSESFPRNHATNIPPVIHFIWFKDLYETKPSVTEMPSVGSDAPELCRQHNPEYTINIWNASAARLLLEEHYSWFLSTYDAYKFPIQRVDAFKYFLLWHYGGVYIDMDTSCRRPLEPLLQFPAWFPEASPLGVNNDLMAARPRHPVIRRMLESLKKRNKNLRFPYLTVFWSTGPQFTSDILKECAREHAPKYMDGANKVNSGVDEWFALPQVFYSEEFSFFEHRPGGTWHGKDVAFVLWFVAHPLVFLSLVVTIIGGGAGILMRRGKVKRIVEIRKHWEI